MYIAKEVHKIHKEKYKLVLVIMFYLILVDVYFYYFNDKWFNFLFLQEEHAYLMYMVEEHIKFPCTTFWDFPFDWYLSFTI